MNKQDRDDPLVWMLLLERGRRIGDFELAARAKRELERLGIRILYSRGGCQRKKAIVKP